MAMLAAGCSPKPYMGEARDLHEEMGRGGEVVEAPQLEASPGRAGAGGSVSAAGAAAGSEAGGG